LADANRRLNQVSSFDRETNKMLGFQVVARLAARHDIKVMLTTTPGGNGVTAIVRLPKAILEVVAAPGTAAPVVDVPAMAQRLSEPLPLTVSAGATHVLEQPTQMTDEALWEAMKGPETAPVGATLAAPVASNGLPMPEPLLTTQSGLPKRVRGAQMPELGSTPMEDVAPRPADEVRETLASLQRGVDLGRQRSSDS
jgi:hypothetical protein